MTALPADTFTHHPSGSISVSAQPAPVPPLSTRAAIAIFGTMVLMIVALTAVLVSATWFQPDGSVGAPAPDQSHFAQR